MKTYPSSGRSRKFRQRMKVDFPAPEGPKMHTALPAFTERLTPSTATSPPKRLVIFHASRTGRSTVTAGPPERRGRGPDVQIPDDLVPTAPARTAASRK